MCLAYSPASSPRPSPPSASLSIVCTFSVHTIDLLTWEPLADWKALLQPSLAAPKLHAHSVDARGQEFDSLPDDLKIAIPSGGGPCSEALGLLLAVGARDQHFVVGRPMVRVDADIALPPGWTQYWSNSVLLVQHQDRQHNGKPASESLSFFNA